MRATTVLLRCGHCRTINRVSTNRVRDNPKCGKCKAALEFSEKPIDITSATFDNEVLVWPGIVLVEFWATWCGACRMVAPAIDEMARERAGQLKIARVNVDNEPSLGMRFGIGATPAFILFRNGQKLNEVTGALPKKQLEAWIDSSL